jgi:hypothetical protein
MLKTMEQRETRQDEMRLRQEAIGRADAFREQHYRIRELAKMWSLGVETVRRQVRCEPDVVKVSGPNGRTTYSIPESVARRIHTKLTAPPKPGLISRADLQQAFQNRPQLRRVK